MSHPTSPNRITRTVRLLKAYSAANGGDMMPLKDLARRLKVSEKTAARYRRQAIATALAALPDGSEVP